MSENQETPDRDSQVENLKTNLGKILTSWKFRLGFVASVIVVGALLVFFWPHLVAVAGMKSWSAQAGAQPIECMLKDTNDNHYISCSAVLNEQIVPLECSDSVFNLGCRVNYSLPMATGKKR